VVSLYEKLQFLLTVQFFLPISFNFSHLIFIHIRNGYHFVVIVRLVLLYRINGNVACWLGRWKTSSNKTAVSYTWMAPNGGASNLDIKFKMARFPLRYIQLVSREIIPTVVMRGFFDIHNINACN
jgi:hypothetical protein